MRVRAGIPFQVAMLVFCAGFARGAPATMELEVDATGAAQGLFRARLVVPARPGPMTLAYPKWIQGEHSPYGPISRLAGLTFTANGTRLAWRRDPLDTYLFRVEVPRGASTVTVELEYLSPATAHGPGYGHTPNATRHLLIVDWNNVLLYPRGTASDALPVKARLRLPKGWKHDAALAATAEADGTLQFPVTTLFTLLDSPVLAADNLKVVQLDSGERPAWVAVATDRAIPEEIPPDILAAYRALLREAEVLFGARHYRSYRWLIALGDTLERNGIEHAESTDIRVPFGFFTDPNVRAARHWLVPHEFIHSWNGKYRRPRGLVGKDPNQPLDGELLWVYEGLTRYLQMVLGARSGLYSPEEIREEFAYRAQRMDRGRGGRWWRPVADTAVSAQDLLSAPAGWTSERRGYDYYDEPMVVWLEVDAILRERSGGKRSLDDFCRAFFGGVDGPPELRPYVREDVEAALSRLVPFDWRAFFTTRLYEVQPRLSLEGFSKAGWNVVYDARRNGFEKAWATSIKQEDHTASIGAVLGAGGVVRDVVVGSPAWRGGFAEGMKIVAVGDKKFSLQVLEEALTAATTQSVALASTKGSSAPLEFSVEQAGEAFRLKVDYSGGPQHAHLVRDPSRPDVLSAILAPRSSR